MGMTKTQAAQAAASRAWEAEQARQRTAIAELTEVLKARPFLRGKNTVGRLLLVVEYDQPVDAADVEQVVETARELGAPMIALYQHPAVTVTDFT